MSKRITEEDIANFIYYNTERTPVERWCDWPEKRGIFRTQFPEYFRTRAALLDAEERMESVLESIAKYNPEEE